VAAKDLRAALRQAAPRKLRAGEVNSYDVPASLVSLVAGPLAPQARWSDLRCLRCLARAPGLALCRGEILEINEWQQDARPPRSSDSGDDASRL
jgi:hypothetical protein